jgi:hypothetical protein
MKKYILLVAYFLFATTLFATNTEPITPVFSTIPAIYNPTCYATAITNLPSFSENGYEGIWTTDIEGVQQVVTTIGYLSPQWNGYYTFTPTPIPGLIFNTFTFIFTHNIATYPYFNLASPICTTSVYPVLSTTSVNNIVGTWSPTTISPTYTGYYIFTPTNTCMFPAAVNFTYNTPQDCSCGGFLSLEGSEVNTSKIYESFFEVLTSNNYSISGSKTIQLYCLAFVDLLPNTSIESLNFFEASIGKYYCFQDQRPANTNLSVLINEALKNDIIRLTVAPNPSSNTIEVVLNNSTFNKVMITSLDGKTILAAPVTNNESFQVDVSTYANGLYIVSVIDKDGNIYNQKLIKN